MQNSDVLEKLGLSPNESNVYKYLLSNQVVQSAQDIILALSMDKVSVYRALKSLTDQGLVTVTGETRNYKYRVSPTKNLLDKYNVKVGELSSLREQLDELISDATRQQHNFYQRHNIQVFKGLDGYKQWNNERLKGAVTAIMEFGSIEFLDTLFGDKVSKSSYMHAFIKERVKRKISMMSLAIYPKTFATYDKTSAKILKQQRTIMLEDDIQAYMSIFGDSFGFYTKQGNEYIGVIIRDPILTKMIIVFFNALWEKGEIV